MMGFKENDELKEVVERLGELLKQAIQKLNEKIKNKDLSEKAVELLEENKRMLSENVDREKILDHIERVKSFLTKVKELEERAQNQDVDILREDIGLIEQILEEEIPQSVPQLEAKSVEVAKKIPIEEELPERFLQEIETIKEYLRVLSDKIFDLGDEIIELKEKVIKLEQVVLGDESTAQKPVKPEPKVDFKEEKISEAGYNIREVEYLIKDALSVIGRKDENPIKRAIKLEALRILMKKKIQEIDEYPNEVAEQFKQVYSLVTKEVKMLRDVLKEVLRV